MSKKRPRTEKASGEQTTTDRGEPAYWRTRIRKSTYTYRGESRQTSSWHVKFQVNGKRRTITLKAQDPETAALEARDHYRRTVAGGIFHGPLPPSQRDAEDGARTSPSHWHSRLLRRKYLELMRPKLATEWSVVIDHGNVRRLFPLGTMDRVEATERAAERFRVVAQQGWRQANLRFEQEFTIALFWKLNPMVCTYSTMLTIPASLAFEIPARGSSHAIIVEPDEGVRRALRHWLSSQSGFNLRIVTTDPSNFPTMVQQTDPALILVNTSESEDSGSDILKQNQKLISNIPAFTYGVFEDSDGIFASLSGVSGGYFLRRRPPNQLLDPLAGSPSKALSKDRVQRLVRRYFNRLTKEGEGTSSPGVEPSLTIREHEVMVFMAQGLQDKEIANKLDISTWTVNSHARHIYRKFEVHGRTEAVVKFLEMENNS